MSRTSKVAEGAGTSHGAGHVEGRQRSGAGFAPATSPPPIAAPTPLEVLGAQICAAASRMASATCRWLEMLGEFDAREGWAGVGIRSCAHWLAWTCSESPGVAREHVRVARAMRSLPLARAEFAAGRLSYSKMREITRVSDRVDEAALVDLARTATASQLARAVRGMRRSDEEGLAAHARRRVDWYTDGDGMLRLRATLPAEEGAAILAAIQAAHLELAAIGLAAASSGAGARDGAGSGDGGGGSPPGPRAPSEGRGRPSQDPLPLPHADALLRVARGYLASAPHDRSGEDRTLVVVHVDSALLTGEPVATSDRVESDAPARSEPPGSNRPLQTTDSIRADVADDADTSAGPGLRGPVPTASLATDQTAVPSRDCCQVAGVGGVSRDTAARLACDAAVMAMVRGAGGAVLGLGRRRRLVSPAQRRAIMVRDGGCQFPGCHRTTHLDIHHVRSWADGGRTDLDNLVALCRLHHVACHEGGVTIRPAPAALPGLPRWRFLAPDGTEMSPEQALARFRNDADFLSWCALLRARPSDGAAGWHDPRAEAIRPRWAGEPFQLPEVVAALLGNPKLPDSWPQAA